MGSSAGRIGWCLPYNGLLLEEFPAANTWRWMLARCAPLTFCLRCSVSRRARRVRVRFGRVGRPLMDVSCWSHSLESLAGVWAFHFQGRAGRSGVVAQGGQAVKGWAIMGPVDGSATGQRRAPSVHRAVMLPVGRRWFTVPVNPPCVSCCGRGAPASLAPEQHTRNRNGRWERLPSHSRMSP